MMIQDYLKIFNFVEEGISNGTVTAQQLELLNSRLIRGLAPEGLDDLYRQSMYMQHGKLSECEFSVNLYFGNIKMLVTRGPNNTWLFQCDNFEIYPAVTIIEGHISFEEFEKLVVDISVKAYNHITSETTDTSVYLNYKRLCEKLKHETLSFNKDDGTTRFRSYGGLTNVIDVDTREEVKFFSRDENYLEFAGMLNRKLRDQLIGEYILSERMKFYNIMHEFFGNYLRSPY